MRPNNPYNSAILPTIFACILALGIIIGTRLNSNTSNNKNFFSLPQKNFNKINELINFIDQEYVDDIQKEQLIDKAVNNILSDLDPHSYYISEKDLAEANEPLEGNFEGIGIEFNILKDTLIVISTVEGGPSEKAGIIAGDRIIKVNGENIAGKNLQNEDIIKKLKGPKDTKVNVTLQRKKGKLLSFTLKRGKIPIKSVDVGYMINNNTGYIKISRFAKNTHSEFIEIASGLKSQGMTALILDLRGNGGGYLDAAISLADEFLESKKLIVYTQGKARPKTSYYSTNSGSFENTKLTILVDEGSASASEILAGAIQDHDKGLIIGRRTFGKGLVQEQVIWPDNSAIRLTIARYYTPSGRCIQKPYSDNQEYYNETFKRFENGELLQKDSIKFTDSLKFYTDKGRIVFGGGGIMPDLFVPLDTGENTDFLIELNQSGIINQFAFYYVDTHRENFNKFNSFEDFNRKFVINQSIFNEFVDYAHKNGFDAQFLDFKKSSKLINVRIKAHIARQFWKNNGYYQIIHQVDNAFQKAVVSKNLLKELIPSKH
jgi:carboxyl-terminal processing protease